MTKVVKTMGKDEDRWILTDSDIKKPENQTSEHNEDVPYDLYGSAPRTLKNQRKPRKKSNAENKNDEFSGKTLADILPITFKMEKTTNFELICVCGKVHNKGKIPFYGKPGKEVKYVDVGPFRVAQCCYKSFVIMFYGREAIIPFLEGVAEQRLQSGSYDGTQESQFMS